MDGEISNWVLDYWREIGLIHSVKLPDGHVIENLSQETADAYVEHCNAEQIA